MSAYRPETSAFQATDGRPDTAEKNQPPINLGPFGQNLQ